MADPTLMNDSELARYFARQIAFAKRKRMTLTYVHIVRKTGSSRCYHLAVIGFDGHPIMESLCHSPTPPGDWVVTNRPLRDRPVCKRCEQRRTEHSGGILFETMMHQVAENFRVQQAHGLLAKEDEDASVAPPHSD